MLPKLSASSLTKSIATRSPVNSLAVVMLFSYGDLASANALSLHYPPKIAPRAALQIVGKARGKIWRMDPLDN